jgi:hypothetical protein
MKRLLTAAALLIAATTVGHAMAEQRTVYGKNGQALGRSTVDSQGTATLYDPFTGKAVTRTDKNGTVYDAESGRIIVKVPKAKR